MISGELPSLEGTNYEVSVERAHGRTGNYYVVEVKQPFYHSDGWLDSEILFARTLPGDATEEDLDLLVASLIPKAKLNISGTYAAPTEEKELNNGN